MTMIRSAIPDYFLKYKDEDVFRSAQSCLDCFKYFDKNNDEFIDLEEFEGIMKSLFSCNGKPYSIAKEKIEQIFSHFDSHKRNKLDIADFKELWNKFIKQTLFPHSALVIVDVQNDFIDGSLSLKNCPAKQDGAEVVPVINNLINTVPFSTIAYTLDWHPEDHCSFYVNHKMRPLHKYSPTKTDIKEYDTVVFEDYPDVEQKLWPAHCVQGTDGAKLHPDLLIVDEKTDAMKRSVIYAKKGAKSDIDSYSAFFDNCKLNETTLNADLRKHGVTDLYVCGLAADVCVAATSYDGLGLNYRVVFVEDACRGIIESEIEEQKNRLINHGAVVVTSDKVYNMVTCKDRRPELTFGILKSD